MDGEGGVNYYYMYIIILRPELYKLFHDSEPFPWMLFLISKKMDESQYLRVQLDGGINLGHAIHQIIVLLIF